MNKTLISTNAMIFLFAATHIFSDAITNMLSALLPTLQVLYGLTETTLALLVAALSLSALVTQPLFGALADRFGRRRTAAIGVILNGILFSLLGIAPDVRYLFGLILLGGLGSAAFHPALASLARTIGGRRGEVAVGLFSAGGTLGIALGPVIIMMLFARYGLSYTPWLMLPGIFFGLLILMLTTETSETIKAESSKLFDSRLILGPVGLLALTSILSNVAFVTFTSAMPLWLVRAHNLPVDSTLIGWTLSLFSLSAALGGVLGGLISRRLGAKRLIVATSLLALIPLFGVFSLAPGSVSYYGAVALAGALINAGLPLLIVSAQDLSPKNAAAASGMLMGFSGGVAGLIYVGIGKLQETVGLAPAMSAGYLALVLAVFAAWVALKVKPVNACEGDGKVCACVSCFDSSVPAMM